MHPAGKPRQRHPRPPEHYHAVSWRLAVLVLECQQRRPQQILVRVVGSHPARELLPAAALDANTVARGGWVDSRRLGGPRAFVMREHEGAAQDRRRPSLALPQLLLCGGACSGRAGHAENLLLLLEYLLASLRASVGLLLGPLAETGEVHRVGGFDLLDQGQYPRAVRHHVLLLSLFDRTRQFL